MPESQAKLTSALEAKIIYHALMLSNISQV